VQELTAGGWHTVAAQQIAWPKSAATKERYATVLFANSFF
jgi:hypothetical protein